MTIQFEQLFKQALPAVQSKRNELRLYGYPTVTDDEIWKYCIQKKWRKKKMEDMPIHEVVSGILRLTAAEFMTYTQIEQQRDSNWFSDLNNDELQLLLSPKKAE